MGVDLYKDMRRSGSRYAELHIKSLSMLNIQTKTIVHVQFGVLLRIRNLQNLNRERQKDINIYKRQS